MVWIIVAIVILAISAYFANEYRLDRKAHRLRDGSEEDRRLLRIAGHCPQHG